MSARRNLKADNNNENHQKLPQRARNVRWEPEKLIKILLLSLLLSPNIYYGSVVLRLSLDLVK